MEGVMMRRDYSLEQRVLMHRDSIVTRRDALSLCIVSQIDNVNFSF